MKWLTLTEIGRRARSKKGALEVSYEHWCQLFSATAKELREKYEKTDGEIQREDYCGLCRYDTKRYAYSGHCKACVFDDFCEFSLWGEANSALREWNYKANNINWRAWKRAAKAVRDKLKELMESV